MSDVGWLNMVNREPWQADGICLQVDQGDCFFPDKGDSTKAAKLVCQHCPVIDACLDFALRTEQAWGVWGGRSERERYRILRGEDVPFVIPGMREVPINECQRCGKVFKGGKGKYCGDDCRSAMTAEYRRKRYQAAVEAHGKRSA